MRALLWWSLALLPLLFAGCPPDPVDDDVADDDSGDNDPGDDDAADDDSGDDDVADDDSGDDDMSDDDDSGDDDDSAAATFACGPDIRCAIESEYCEIFYPGAKGAPIQYSCPALPDECMETPTCECLALALGSPDSSSCQQGADGSLTWSFFAP